MVVANTISQSMQVYSHLFLANLSNFFSKCSIYLVLRVNLLDWWSQRLIVMFWTCPLERHPYLQVCTSPQQDWVECICLLSLRRWPEVSYILKPINVLVIPLDVRSILCACQDHHRVCVWGQSSYSSAASSLTTAITLRANHERGDECNYPWFLIDLNGICVLILNLWIDL